MLDGAYIHADYDLYDIVLASHPRGNLGAVEELHGQRHIRGVRVIPIQNFVNGMIGTDMIQHGGQAQYRHLDPENDATEVLDLFTPDGEHRRLNGYQEIQQQYEAWGRTTIAPGNEG
jgi:hypothetical protein